jgi:hypothetical protein
MKKRLCPTCKNKFAPPPRGRRPRYCSAACRQKAYRKRTSDPHAHLKALCLSDLYKIEDKTARAQAAIKVLVETGHAYLLANPHEPKPKKPTLKLVKPESDE